jgi:proline dehydrogenase
MIKLARSPRVKNFMQETRSLSNLATRYVAGATPEAGVLRAKELLNQKNIRSSLFYLGEYVNTSALVAKNVMAKKTVADLLNHAGLDVHISVDPTQVGYGLDPKLARANIFEIGESVALFSNRPGMNCLMLDMEDQSVTDATIRLHNDLLAANLPAALTLQAYLRRTKEDLQNQIKAGARVRLVRSVCCWIRLCFYASGRN